MSKKRPAEPARSRDEAGHTQVQASELIGVSLRTWEDWEGGRATMHPAFLQLYRHLAGLKRIPFKGEA